MSSQYYPPYKSSSNNIKVELDLSNYATKKDINDITHVDVSGFASKTNLAALKTEVDKIDADKLKTVPVDLAKLSNVVKNEVIKKADYNAKVTTLENKIDGVEKKTDISGLATKTSLNDYLQTSTFNSKVTKVENKMKYTDIIAKSANSGFFYYLQKSYLVFECKIHSFNFNNGKISEWKSTGIFNYSSDSNMRGIEDPKTKLPELKNDGRMHVSLFGNYFEQNKVIIPNNNNVINIYCVYELQQVNIPLSIEFTILNALFGAMEITKNANTSKYKYKGYGICFDKGGSFSEGSINNGRNVLICGVHESSLLHSNNKANNIYVMGKDFVQGINDTTLYAEKVYSQNFTQLNKKFVLSLHFNDDNSYLFVNGKQELKLKCKTDQLVKEKLCIGNLSNNWSPIEAQKTGLYGNIYDFVGDSKAINGVKKIYDMHRYLMTKHDIV